MMRTERPARRVMGLCIAVFGLGAAAVPARAQDGPTLIKRMEAAYAGLQSYSQTARATNVTRLKGRSSFAGSSTQLRYRRPNLASVSLTNPRTGTLQVCTDGRQMLSYFTAVNGYTKGPAPATMAEFLRLLSRMGVAAPLDALYFLGGGQFSRVATDPVAKGVETVDGARCNKVAAALRTNKPAPGVTGQATLWIDASSNLLRQVRIEFHGVRRQAAITRLKNGKKVVTNEVVTTDQTILEVVQDMQVNPALPDSTFRFTPPKGAIERNLSKYLGK